MSWGPKNQQGQTDSRVIKRCFPSSLSLREKEHICQSLKRGDAAWVDVFMKKAKADVNTRPVLKEHHRQSGRRSLSEIARISPPTRDIFHGCPQPTDREEEKQRLIDIFCRQDSSLQPDLGNDSYQLSPLSVQKKDVKELLKDQIEDEINDRIRFLKEIANYNPYKKLVETEIGIRLKELQQLAREAHSR